MTFILILYGAIPIFSSLYVVPETGASTFLPRPTSTGSEVMNLNMSAAQPGSSVVMPPEPMKNARSLEKML